MDSEAKASRRKRWLLGALALVVFLACALSFRIPPNDNAASYDTESMAQLIAGGPGYEIASGVYRADG